MANFKYLRATGMVETFTNRLENVIDKIEASRRRIGFLSSLLEGSREPILICVITVVIFIQANVLQGTLGPILISLLFFYRSLTALTGMQNAWNKFLGVSGSLENLKDFQQALLKHQEPNGVEPFVSLKEEIRLYNVFFLMAMRRY